MKTTVATVRARLGRLCLAGVLALAAGCSKASRATRHFERAESYLQAGERDKAEIEYLNALRLQPEDVRPVERLGRLYYEQGRFPRALAFLLRTRELNPEHLEARLRAAQILSALGQTREAREEAWFVLERQPTNQEALLILAESPRTTNELAEVQARLEQLRPALGDGSGFFLAQATLAMVRRDSNTAARASLEAVQRDPRSVVAHQVRGGFLVTINDLTNAIRAFETAAQLAPARSLVPLRLAELYLQAGDRARARSTLSNLLATASDYLPAQLQLLKLDLAEGRFEECEAMITRVLNRESTLLEPLLARAQLRLARGQPEPALKEMERVVGLYPRSPQVQYQYAIVLLANGNETKAAGALDQALGLDPNLVDATLLRARLYMRRGDTAAAQRVLTELLRKRPGLVPARLTLAEVHGLRGESAQALAIFERLIEEYPSEAQFHFLRGLVLRDMQKPAEAYSAFEQAWELAPGSLQILRQMVEMLLARQQFEEARRLLAEPLARDPKAAEPRVLLALTFLAQRDLARAEEILTQTVEAAPDARPAHLLLAQVLIAAGKQEQALQRLEQVVARNPQDVAALMQMGMLRDSLGQPEPAAEAYRRVLEVNPNHQPALNNLAYLYSEHFGRRDEAYDLARRARELAPNDPFSADTLGWIVFRRGDYAWALTLIEETARALPGEPEVQYHLGMVHYMLGQEEAARAALQRAVGAVQEFRGKAEAREALEFLTLDPAAADPATAARLEKRLKNMPADPVAARRLAAISERRGNPERAAQLYEALFRANPKATFAALQLAELQLARLNNPSRALEYARAARNRAPEDPRVAQQAGRVALRAGDARWAYSLLQESARQLPGDPEVRFDLAVAAYHVGRVGEAEAALQALTRSGGNSTLVQTAGRWLELIRAAAQPDAAVGAAPLAREMLTADPNCLPAHFVFALAAEHQGDRAAARQAYERLLAQQPEFAPASRQLVLLRVGQGEDDPQVFALATRVREAFPRDAEVAAALGILALRRGDFTRAVQLLGEALRERPDVAEWQYYLGLAHYRLKQPQQSKAALEKAVSLNLNAELTREARRILTELK